MQVQFSGIGTEPITLTEAKSYMRVTVDDDDTFIGSVITQAREFVETITGLSLVIKTVNVFYLYPETVITLPYPEHDEISAVVLDGVDVLSSTYVTGLTQKIINIPSVSIGSGNDAGLTVTYTTSGGVPSGLMDVMYKVIQEMYDNRGNTSYDVKENLKYNVMMMIQPYIQIV